MFEQIERMDMERSKEASLKTSRYIRETLPGIERFVILSSIVKVSELLFVHSLYFRDTKLNKGERWVFKNVKMLK